MICPQDILDLAERMNNAGCENSINGTIDEMSFREAASLAYYSCYHKLLIIAREKGFISNSKNTSVHKNLLDFLIDNNDSSLKECGVVLGPLRDRRRKADYDIHDYFPRNDAKYCIDKAKIIFLTVDGIEI